MNEKIKKPLKSISRKTAFASICGFVCGILLFCAYPKVFDAESIPQVKSVIGSGHFSESFAGIFVNEAAVLLAVFLCGFSAKCRACTSVILFIKGCAVGFSASLLYCMSDITVYLIHTLTASLVLIDLSCMSCRADCHSHARGQKPKNATHFLSYAAEFLFFCGILIIILILRQILLLFA